MKNVAVIGYGGQGAWHCAQIEKSDVAALSGVYDINNERNEKAKEKGIFVYNSLDELLSDKNIDIVVVATPNDVHEELVVKALKNGHNVVCEKPVSMKAIEFENMLRAEEISGKLLSVHQNRRWDTDFLSVKKVIDSGEIGDVIRIESRIHGSRGIPGDWRKEKDKGGGMILDWGVHLIDQMLKLICEKVVSVNCVCTHITNYEVDDGFRLELEFETGKTALVEVGTYNFIQMPRFYMQCKEGTLMQNNWQEKAKVSRLTRWIEKDVTPVQNAAGITKTMAPRDALTLDIYEIDTPQSDVHDFYRNIVNAIDKKENQLIKNSEVLRVLKVMEKAFESADRKQTLKVNI